MGTRCSSILLVLVGLGLPSPSRVVSVTPGNVHPLRGKSKHHSSVCRDSMPFKFLPRLDALQVFDASLLGTRIISNMISSLILLGRDKQQRQSRRSSFCLFSSSTMAAVKNVAEKAQRKTRSVRLVTVILAPARARLLEPRFTRASSVSPLRGPFRSQSKALAITNASSTPIQSKRNGRTEWTGE